jgi:hypothetical protein
MWRTTFYYERPSNLRERFARHYALALQRDIFTEDNSCFQKQQAMLQSGGKPFIQLGESEILLRHLAAVLSGIGRKIRPSESQSPRRGVAGLLGGTDQADPRSCGAMKIGNAVRCFGGLDTVLSTLGLFFLHLAEHPDQQTELRANPAGIDHAVEEPMRRYSVASVNRRCVKDITLGGVFMKAGDWPHFCLGMHLARRELTIALREWLARIPPWRVKANTTPLLSGGGVYGVEWLALQWGSAVTAIRRPMLAELRELDGGTNDNLPFYAMFS